MIRRRGAGWNVMLRVDGRRYEYGPRKVPVLRYGSRKEVEEWAWTEYRNLVRQAKADTGSAGPLTFSGLVGLFREQVMPGLAPGGRRSYENSFRTARASRAAGDPTARSETPSGDDVARGG